MIKYTTETIEQKVPESVICDVCKTEYSCRDEVSNEVQEFTFINFTGGYDSIFGDGVNMKADICQHCLKKILGDYLRGVDYVMD